MEVESTGESKDFSVNNDGLVRMTFNRFLGNLDNKKSEFVSNVDLALFDKSGSKVLSIIQKNKGKLRFRYGFEDNMSETFNLTINKLNSTFNNLGCMVAIGAIGNQVGETFPPEFYDRETSIEDILVAIANRNNWDLGKNNSNINVGNLKLPWGIYKKPDETDASFIEDKILPVCNLSASTPDASYSGQFWDFRIYDTPEGKTQLMFRPYVDREGIHSEKVKVWKYTYGGSLDSSVIDLTNTINYDFLIKGLTVKVPALFIETLGEQDTIEDRLNELLFDKLWDSIISTLERFNLPVPKKDEFRFSVELIEAEDEDAGTLERIENRFINELKKAIMSINTINLVVIGNPDILPTDLVDLTVMNRPEEEDKKFNIVSGLWKVIKIKEEIGLTGYKTTLGLVRHNIDIQLDPEIEGDG
jgi:hypothetical protein